MADNYRVLSQRQTVLNQGGQFVPAMEVTFETASGHTGSVKVPRSQYPHGAKAIIEKEVADVESVAGL